MTDDQDRIRRPSQMLIAFTGPAGCGKTTAARYMVDRYGFVRIRFADPMKRMLAALGLDDAELDGGAKEKPSAVLCGRTPRWAMQSLGTEWGRHCIAGDLWIRAMRRERGGSLANMLGNAGRGVVIDDCRFLNEADAIVRDGGVIVHIAGRAPPIAGNHVSERGGIAADVTLENGGTIASLHSQIDALIRDLSWVTP